MELNYQVPRWAHILDQPSRYKVLYGGRGAARSWSIARKLIEKSLTSQIRILCARELQVSIKDSVHQLLKLQIEKLKVSELFRITNNSIQSQNGSEFIFKGLRHNSKEIKSMEDVTICWIEEAQKVSEESLEDLIPTIRTEGSEIWLSFNPDLETDPVYKRFVVSPPPDALTLLCNYDANPFFPSVLERERAYKLRVDPEGYRHVWLGETRRHSHAQVLYGKWRVDVFEPEATWNGPYFGADWGYSTDPSVLIRFWINGRKLMVEHEAYGVGVSLDDTYALFASVPGSQRATIRADCSRPETINHLRKSKRDDTGRIVHLGYPNLAGAVKWPGSVEEGIEHLRNYEEIVIHERCKHTIEEASDWQWKTDRLSGDPLPILRDGNDHCWDAIRYGLAPMIRARNILFG